MFELLTQEPFKSILASLAAIVVIGGALLGILSRRKPQKEIPDESFDKPNVEPKVSPGTDQMKFVSNGLSFFQNALVDIVETGGQIFTTAIFDNYRDGDIIHKFILNKLRSTSSTSNELVFTRFMLLDDPSMEYDWMRGFLDLKDQITSQTHGFLLRPIVLHVPNRNRPLIRYLSKSIPRASISLIKYNETQDTAERYLVYFGFSTNFGIEFSSKVLYEKTQDYLTTFRQRAIPYEDIQPILGSGVSPGVALVRRIQDHILELGELKKYILHVGLFGSRGRLFRQRISELERSPQDADIDFLIVVSSATNINPSFKQGFEDVIRQEMLPGDPELEIEWSNLDAKYYEERHSCHIDIQIHHKGDEYYTKRALLLGYSIFDESYVSLYSSSNESVYSCLTIPENILTTRDRIPMVLNSEEYGLITALGRVCDFSNYPNTDPKRLLWIHTSNTVWALSGTRPHTHAQALDFLSNVCSYKGQFFEITDGVRKLLEKDVEHSCQDKSIRTECECMLKLLRDLLQSEI